MSKEPEFLVIGTAQGRVKRTAMEAVRKNVVEGTWTEVIGLVSGDRVAFAGTCTEKGSILFFTDSKVLHIEASAVSDQQTPSARGVAGIYAPIAQAMLIDRVDAEQLGDVEALGLRARAEDTLMKTPEVARSVAAATLELAGQQP